VVPPALVFASLKQHILAMPDVGDDADLEAPRPVARRVEL
jgi:hypothetical protein